MSPHSFGHDAFILLFLLTLFTLPIVLYSSTSSRPHLGLGSIIAEWMRETFASVLWWLGMFGAGLGLFLCVLGGEMGHRMWVRRGRKKAGAEGGGGSGGGGAEGSELIGQLGADDGEEERRRVRRVTREERYERKVEHVVDALKGKRTRTSQRPSSREEVEMKDLSGEVDTTTTATKSKDHNIRRRMPPPPPPL
ncbi:BZ3500_MvSof-1268-A1-R1_Chr3-1g05894 [Microbotryum saponariae]|uniref:BZ3500_MvSof-1268-A1-R1_Chr3-1g05894 protein n=1 Tax=Microbotryum saponariae TaxID=289078 RepID=A0A2X0KYH9_9BASI|nr:BZ3500_MvSof-1268-A1-R1_Chr3-1g05894 [Microbotryum saponariae]SDA05084.1 BZ3501_MvSof-1269-A2-R1_Chr3-1g05564 [Microbotryum saponariae]